MSELLKLEQIRIRMFERIINENKQLRKQLKEDEEDYKILQKIIECFNSSSDNISLNASFEENSYNEDENYVGYKFLNDSNINDKNIFGIL